MKSSGYLLLIAGFLAAAYFTVLDIQSTAWAFFVPAALAAMVGVFLIKKHARGESQAEHVLTANKAELNESLGNIVTGLDELLAGVGSTPTAEIRNMVDARLRDDLRRFADARESMIHLYGVQTYANIMSEFAAGERYVNRVWSASADDYRQESTRYLRRAADQFHEALQTLQKADG
jgi:hypothetical protein